MDSDLTKITTLAEFDKQVDVFSKSFSGIFEHLCYMVFSAIEDVNKIVEYMSSEERDLYTLIDKYLCLLIENRMYTEMISTLIILNCMKKRITTLPFKELITRFEKYEQLKLALQSREAFAGMLRQHIEKNEQVNARIKGVLGNIFSPNFSNSDLVAVVGTLKNFIHMYAKQFNDDILNFTDWKIILDNYRI